MVNLTLNHILKYLSVAIIVAIILLAFPENELDKNYIALVALGAAVFTFLLDLIFSYFRQENMANVMPYDPYNIYNIVNKEVEASILMDPKRYQYITRDQDGKLYYDETGIPGYYLINNGEFSDGTVPFDTSSQALSLSRKANFAQVDFNSAMTPCNLFVPEAGKDRPYINVEPVPTLNMRN